MESYPISYLILAFTNMGFTFVSGSRVDLSRPASQEFLLINQLTSPLLVKQNKSVPRNYVLSFTHPDELAFTKEIMQIGKNALNGRRLKVVTIERRPFAKISEGNDGIKSYDGVIFEFLSTVANRFNFTMNIFTPPDGNWGEQPRNRHLNGMLGLIVRKEADVGAAPFSVTLERTHVLDFTVAFHQEPTAILIPAPVKAEKFKVLIRPLRPKVWFGVGLSIVAIIPAFYALHLLSVRIHSRERLRIRLETSLKLIQFIFGSLVQESIVSPFEKTTRLPLILWWLTTLVLSNIYVGILVSFMSVPKLKNAINSLEELVGQSSLHWTFRFGTVHHRLFKSETSTGIFKEIGDGVDDEELVISDFEGLAKVLSGNWVFIKERSFLDVALDADFRKENKCRLSLAQKEFFKVGFGLVVPKKCPYLPLFNKEISNAIATGLMKKWKSIHWPKNIYCARADEYMVQTQSSTRRLRLSDIQGAILLLGAGLLIATGVFLAESILWFYRLVVDLIKSKFICKFQYSVNRESWMLD